MEDGADSSESDDEDSKPSTKSVRAFPACPILAQGLSIAEKERLARKEFLEAAKLDDDDLLLEKRNLSNEEKLREENESFVSLGDLHF